MKGWGRGENEKKNIFIRKKRDNSKEIYSIKFAL